MIKKKKKRKKKRENKKRAYKNLNHSLTFFSVCTRAHPHYTFGKKLELCGGGF